MKNTRKVLVLAVVIVAIGTIAVPVAGANNSTTESPTPTTTESAGVEKAEQLGDLVVHDYHVDNQTMIIEMTWNGKVPTSATMTEMLPMDNAGTAKISFKTVRLLPDTRTTVEVDVSTSPEVDAVMLSTPESVEQGEALLLREQGSGSDVEYRKWWVALLTGSFGTIFTFAGVKKWRDWRASESIWRVPIDD
jgi:hypothetical protein